MEALSRKLEFNNKGQVVFTFGDNWSLSVINNGYGARDGLFEIAPMADDEIQYVEGISTELDNVRGYLTEDEVFEYVDKMSTITGYPAKHNDSSLPYW